MSSFFGICAVFALDNAVDFIRLFDYNMFSATECPRPKEVLMKYLSIKEASKKQGISTCCIRILCK